MDGSTTSAHLHPEPRGPHRGPITAESTIVCETVRVSYRLLACVATTALVLGACGDGGSAPGSPSPGPSGVAPSPSPSPSLRTSPDPDTELCQLLAETETRLASLRAVELKLPNRVALDIELEKLVAAYNELDDVDLGDRADELERSLTRLKYRLGDLDLAVEDFRTNPTPRKAAPHVESDAQRVADELAAFVVLSRC